MNDNKMTQGPWRIKKFANWGTNVVGKGEGNDICEMSSTHSKLVQNANASAIAAAVNGTYGKSIHPDSPIEMLHALELIVKSLTPLMPETVISNIVSIAKVAIAKSIIK
jgi:hypothetical protein